MSTKKSRSVSNSTSREEQGREGRRKGLDFEQRVGEVYRLLHYDVEFGRIFSGRQVDLFLTGRFGDLTVQRAIECKIGPVTVDDLDAFLSKLRLVRRDFPSVQGTIVSAVSFSDAVAAHAHQEGITLTLFRDLSAQLLDGHRYAIQLVKSCEENERYPIKFYIQPSIGWEPAGEALPATQILQDWLHDANWNQLTLLGDVGTGKSFLCRMLAYDLGRAFLSNPLQNPLPILIDLRNADRQFSLEGLILTHLSNSGLPRASFDAFAHALSHGNIVLILDGFDEMSARVSPFVTVRNFHELVKCVTGQAKVILTCRTHYFKSRTEEEEIILGGGQNLASESARELYWDLISRKGFQIAYMRPFSLPQIENYVQLRRPFDFKHALDKIRETYNLLELSQRPMLLEMIVKSLDKIGASDINPAALYKIYTDAWIQRDHWRDVLNAEKKLAFLTGLAHALWSEDTPRIHYSVLQERLRHELASDLQDPQKLVEIDSEIRTASFLTRDSAGNYEFAHKSYSEFFLARSLAQSLSRAEIECLRLRRLSPEVISFLFDLVDLAIVEKALETTLVKEYVPLLSENALVVLYGFRREQWRRLQHRQQQEGEAVQVRMPVGVMLNGANLHHLSLEGVQMEGAQLEGASLQEVILVNANLSGSNLRHANLESAVLTQANLVRTSLVSCSLVGAHLENAKLDDCDLSGADLRDAYVVGTSAVRANWTGVKVADAVLSDELAAVVRTRVAPETLIDETREGRGRRVNEFWSHIELLLPRMRAYARTLSVRGSVEAEDVVSEALLALARHNTADRVMNLNESNLESYVLHVIRNVVNSMLVRERKYWRLENPRAMDDRLLALDEEGVAMEIGGVDLQDPLSTLILREAITRTERQLSKRSLRVFHRFYIEGLSATAIAELEGISRPSVMKILRAARRVLLQNLEGV